MNHLEKLRKLQEELDNPKSTMWSRTNALVEWAENDLSNLIAWMEHLKGLKTKLEIALDAYEKTNLILHGNEDENG